MTDPYGTPTTRRYARTLAQATDIVPGVGRTVHWTGETHKTLTDALREAEAQADRSVA